MSDVNELLIAPLEKFSKDSMHLIKKCTKPDRKGEYGLRVWFVRLVPYLTTRTMVLVAAFCCGNSTSNRRRCPQMPPWPTLLITPQCKR